MDMVGNVCQWANECEDEHTRTAILGGGRYFRSQGSAWYFPQAYRNDEHSKSVLIASSYDRSDTIGFRYVRMCFGGLAKELTSDTERQDAFIQA